MAHSSWSYASEIELKVEVGHTCLLCDSRIGLPACDMMENIEDANPPNLAVEKGKGDVVAPSLTQPHESSNPTITLYSSPGKGKSPIFNRSNSPPPILHSPLVFAPPPLPSEARDLRSTVVDSVSAALEEEGMDEDNNQEEGLSENDDDILLDEEGPDNSVTLDQFQEEARRETLVRKRFSPCDLFP